MVLAPVDRHRRADAVPVHSTPPGRIWDMAAQHKNAGARIARVPPLASRRLTVGRCRSGRPRSSWVIRTSSERRPSPAGLAAAIAGLAGA